MRNRISLLCVGLSALAWAAGTSIAAGTHVIIANEDDPAPKWSYNGQKSPLITVGDLKIGDVIDVQVPDTLQFPHGFVTIKTTPPPITPNEDLVMKCGETTTTKPNAVLKEDCAPGAQSQFGQPFTGSMKLIVLDKFKQDVPFWCVVHKGIMRGVLKLQAAKPK